jgi:hypothetical protein
LVVLGFELSVLQGKCSATLTKLPAP